MRTASSSGCCSPGASTGTTATPTSAPRARGSGYTLWGGYDRPSPDYANARVILLISSHLETGHYFNPHAQRIMEGKVKGGAKLVVLDPRLSNTASHADLWMSPWPGSEAAILLAIASYLLRTDQVAWDYVRRWINWDTYLRELHPDVDPGDFAAFQRALTEEYAPYTFEYAAQEAQIPAEQVEELAKLVAGAEGRLAAHVWRAATAGNLGGWMVARALFFLTVLTGQRRDRRAGPAPTDGTSSSRTARTCRAATTSGTRSSGRRSTRCRPTRCRSCCRTC